MSLNQIEPYETSTVCMVTKDKFSHLNVTIISHPSLTAGTRVTPVEVLTRGIILARVQSALVRVVFTMYPLPGGRTVAEVTEHKPYEDIMIIWGHSGIIIMNTLVTYQEHNRP